MVHAFAINRYNIHIPKLKKNDFKCIQTRKKKNQIENAVIGMALPLTFVYVGSIDMKIIQRKRINNSNSMRQTCRKN